MPATSSTPPKDSAATSAPVEAKPPAWLSVPATLLMPTPSNASQIGAGAIVPAESLNIWMTTTLFSPHIGGAERMVEALARGLSARGHSVTVVTRHFAPETPRTEHIDGYRVLRVGLDGGKYRNAISFLLHAAAVMVRNSRDIDVIHAHQMFSPTLLGALVSWIGRPKLVVTAHRGGPEGDVRILQRKKAGDKRIAAYRRVADAFTVISSEIRDELLEIGIDGSALHDVPNGIDTSSFAPVDESRRVATADRLGLPTSGWNVVFGARLVPIKGVDTLLDAIQHLDPNVNVLIAGDGEESDRVRHAVSQVASGRLTYLGPRHDMPDVLAACHAWVLPSRGEGLPLSLLEAMSAGLVVVTTDVGAIREVVRDGVNGIIVAVDDAAGLAAGIHRALQHRSMLAAAGRATVVESYSADSMIDRHEDLFTAIVGR